MSTGEVIKEAGAGRNRAVPSLCCLLHSPLSCYVVFPTEMERKMGSQPISSTSLFSVVSFHRHKDVFPIEMERWCLDDQQRPALRCGRDHFNRDGERVSHLINSLRFEPRGTERDLRQTLTAPPTGWAGEEEESDGQISLDEFIAWYLQIGCYYFERPHFESMKLAVPRAETRDSP